MDNESIDDSNMSMSRENITIAEDTNDDSMMMTNSRKGVRMNLVCGNIPCCQRSQFNDLFNVNRHKGRKCCHRKHIISFYLLIGHYFVILFVKISPVFWMWDESQFFIIVYVWRYKDWAVTFSAEPVWSLRVRLGIRGHWGRRWDHPGRNGKVSLIEYMQGSIRERKMEK